VYILSIYVFQKATTGSMYQTRLLRPLSALQ